MPISIAERRRRSPQNSTPAIVSALREQIEADIERLIGLLDALDGDPDLEPSVGCIPLMGASTCDLEEDGCDLEESLGWPQSQRANSAPLAGWETMRNWGVRQMKEAAQLNLQNAGGAQ